MSARVDAKAARLLALAHAIQEGYFNPDNVNMSEVAVNLGVSRGTIMRDLRLVESLMNESKRLQAILRNNPVGTTARRRNT